MKLFLPLHKREQFVSVVNSFLPADIRVHGLTKVSKGFNAKLFCSKRRYHYLLPTYMLMDHKIVNEKLLAAFKEQGAIAGAGYEGVPILLQLPIITIVIVFITIMILVISHY